MNAKGLSYILLLTLSSSIYATDLTLNQNGISVSTTEQAIANDGLSLSKALLDTSVQLADIASKNNALSQSSMLQLSQDIGAMADRINVMADKIVATQNIQSANLEMTEKNILEAQKNISNALQGVNDAKMEQSLQNIKGKLDTVLEKERVNIDIATSKNMDEILSRMDKVVPQYRYKYMNAIKENIYSMDKQDREKAFQDVIARIESMKEGNQQEMNSEEISSMSSPEAGSIGGDMGGVGSDAGDAGGSSAGGNSGGMF